MNDNDRNEKTRPDYPADTATQLLLSAYLDDALPETERKAFAEAMEHNPALRAQYEACRADRDWLRDALAPLAVEPAPHTLRHMLHTRTARRPEILQPRLAVAAIILCLVSAGLGWLGGAHSVKSADNTSFRTVTTAAAAGTAELHEGARDVVKAVAEHETAGIEGMAAQQVTPAPTTAPQVVNDALIPLIRTEGKGLPETATH